MLLFQNEDSKIFRTNLTVAWKDGVQGTKMGLYASVDRKEWELLETFLLLFVIKPCFRFMVAFTGI